MWPAVTLRQLCGEGCSSGGGCFQWMVSDCVSGVSNDCPIAFVLVWDSRGREFSGRLCLDVELS